MICFRTTNYICTSMVKYIKGVLMNNIEDEKSLYMGGAKNNTTAFQRLSEYFLRSG